MKFFSTIGVIALVSLTTASCDRGLSGDDARRLLEERYAGQAATCAWQGYRQTGDASYGFHPYHEGECAKGLQAAGIIRLGGAVEDNKVSFVPEPSVKFDLQAVRMNFPCGRMKFVEVKAVTTDTTATNKAAIRFTREFERDDDVLAKLSACRLIKPDAGTVEKTWNASRDDDGRWTLLGG
jgi:hypothetical protein